MQWEAIAMGGNRIGKDKKDEKDSLGIPFGIGFGSEDKMDEFSLK